MKNVIVLSCSTGQGHNSCAEAIREYFNDRELNCQVRDSFDFISPRFARFMSWGHSFIYRHIPGLFTWGYRFSEVHSGIFKNGSIFYKLLTGGTERLYQYLLDGEYDTVLCTHVFAAMAVARLLRRHPLPVQTAFVATDYTCCPGVESSEMQMYFIPCASLRGEFEEHVQTPHRTAVTGIPVRGAFWLRRDKDEAKETLHIGAGSRHLLMMCGSMGCGPLVKLLRRVAGGLSAGMEVTVICGTNERLRRKLARRYKDNGRVHLVGYTEDVSLYMDAADLYLTKPGGISVTEAAAKKLPMAFVNPVAGCEKYNMEYFTRMGAAVTDASLDRLAEKCIRLLSSDEELRRMRRALEEYPQPNGAERIYEELGRGTRR